MLRRVAKQLLIMVSLLLVLGLQPGLVAWAQCPGNVAINPSFEEGFSERGDSQVNVANGWTPFWQDGPDQDKGYNRRPEYGSEDGARYGTKRIHEGNWGQKWYSVYATHNGGVLQQINVPSGSLVDLSAWGQAWSSQKDNPDKSEGGQYTLSVGIDPTGGTDFSSPNVVWSGSSGTLDQWVELKAQARAQGGTVTLFLRGEAAYRVKHNDAYFDDVCVTFVAPTPKATNTPQPTDTPEPTAVPEPTDAAEPEAPAETEDAAMPSDLPPTPMPATIRVYAFDDTNGDGSRDSGEALLAGAGIALTTIQKDAIATYTTTGSGEPFAFDGLQPGNYQVTETDPKGFVSTSPNQWAVALSEGAVVEVYFADQVAPAPTAAPTITAAPTKAATKVQAKPTEAPTVAIEPETSEKGSLFGSALARVSGILLAMLALALPILYRVIRTQL